ncbi:Uma2 family endonuclease [Nocardia sp. NPDC051570]|uniref:Uma2 family endonuclease n=1 Tax=Nocardia sp. NPDC051570 TaxID=3364324 RepID=UPI003794DA4C
MPAPEASSEFLPASDRWTAADLDRLPENGLRYEVMNGQLIVNAAPKPRHQELLLWLSAALLSAMPPDFWVLPGVGVLIGDDEPIPDLVAGQKTVDKDARGVPAEHVLLAVEIVSASTTMMDRMVKPALYAEAGIANYWRIEVNSFKGRLPSEQLPVLFAYVLGDDGEYGLTHRIPAGELVTLRSPFEFTIDPATLLR